MPCISLSPLSVALLQEFTFWPAEPCAGVSAAPGWPLTRQSSTGLRGQASSALIAIQGHISSSANPITKQTSFLHYRGLQHAQTAWQLQRGTGDQAMNDSSSACREEGQRQPGGCKGLPGQVDWELLQPKVSGRPSCSPQGQPQSHTRLLWPLSLLGIGVLMNGDPNHLSCPVTWLPPPSFPNTHFSHGTAEGSTKTPLQGRFNPNIPGSSRSAPTINRGCNAPARPRVMYFPWEAQDEGPGAAPLEITSTP